MSLALSVLVCRSILNIERRIRTARITYFRFCTWQNTTRCWGELVGLVLPGHCYTNSSIQFLFSLCVNICKHIRKNPRHWRDSFAQLFSNRSLKCSSACRNSSGMSLCCTCKFFYLITAQQRPVLHQLFVTQSNT